MPYLFVLVGQALHKVVSNARASNRLTGIELPNADCNQLFIQYTNDNNLTLKGDLPTIEAAFQILDDFHLASSLQTNWTKLLAYWFSSNPVPPWLGELRCPWTLLDQLAKLLGTPIGINVSVPDLDDFLLAKITKKLKYWMALHLSLAARVVVVNSMLSSMLWFFITVWGGSFTIMRCIRGLLCNYFWLGSESRKEYG